MTLRLTLLALLLGGALLATAPPQAPDEQPQLIRPAKQAAKAPGRVLEWSLLVDPLDQANLNAAPMWIRAGMAAQGARWKWTDRHNTWDGPYEGGTALKDLPLKELKELLDKHDAALRNARRAALCSRCDWEYPPITVQTLGDVPLSDVQMLRHLIRLISLHCRMQLAQDRFEDARKDLQVGLALARHTGGSQTLIQDLVAIALAQIMLGRVEEWIQRPGSPNLYWALTELPRPFVDVRGSMRHELGTIYRSFPMLRELKEKKLSADEARALVEKFFVAFARLSGEDAPDWKLKLGIAAMAMKLYPEAKKGLVAAGRTEKEVEALPVPQAVALYHLEEYDRTRDELIKCVALPSWQGYAELEKADRAERARTKVTGNVIIGTLLPATLKVYHAQLRLDRNLAGLRAAEAIRLHMAKHGSAPQKLSEIKVVPLPIDPFTGKGFDDWYSVKGDKAVLDVPPAPSQSIRTGKRYEFPVRAR
jgi:hypothetical protein